MRRFDQTHRSTMPAAELWLDSIILIIIVSFFSLFARRVQWERKYGGDSWCGRSATMRFALSPVAACASATRSSSGLQIRGSQFQSFSSKTRELELSHFIVLVLGFIEASKQASKFVQAARLASKQASQNLQVNTRWKALAEINTMHSFAPFSDLNFFVKNCRNFFAIELMNIHY